MALAISKDIVTQLVKNFFDYTQKQDLTTGVFKSLSPTADSYTIWFSKEDIDALFAANNLQPEDGPGLRIYLGLHADSPTEQAVGAYAATNGGISQPFTDFIGQHCAILVATKKDASGINNDLLNNDNNVSIAIQPGMAFEFGGICPPPSVCGGVSVLP